MQNVIDSMRGSTHISSTDAMDASVRTVIENSSATDRKFIFKICGTLILILDLFINLFLSFLVSFHICMGIWCISIVAGNILYHITIYFTITSTNDISRTNKHDYDPHSHSK